MKKLIPLIIALLIHFAASAGNNVMKIQDATASAGQNFNVNLEIINDDPFVAFQTDISLPAGFGYVGGSALLNPARKVNHLISSAVLTGTNVLRLVAFSLTNANFTGNSGIVATFTLSTPTTVGAYVLAPENAIIGNVQGENILTGTIPGTITLNPPQTVSVCFVITDPNGNPIPNLIITFCGITNPPGQYCFEAVPGTTCSYTIETPGGGWYPFVLIVPDFNILIYVTLYPDPTQNFMILHNVTGTAGNIVTIDLEIINEDTFVGFQHDVLLPAGFGYVAGSAVLNPMRKTDHVINANILQGTNILRAISYSLTNSNFMGNSGVIASYQLTTPYSAGVYTLTPENATISNAQGQNILTGTEPGTITLTAPQAYTVTFVIKDQNQQPVTGATVTLGALINPAGNYIFPNLSPGTYGWTVVKEGYNSESGSVTVANQDVTVNVTLNALPGSNIMKVHNACLTLGSPTNIKIEIINADQFTGFQFDMPLPTGIQYIAGSIALNPARSVDHIIQAAVLPGTNVFRAISFSLTNASFTGNNGIIATFSVTTPSVPGTYTLSLENAIIGNAQGVNIITGTIPGVLSLGCYYLVQFVVRDVNQVNIPGATVTLGNITNPAGNYLFTFTAQGTYTWTVFKEGYTPASGNVTVTDQNVTVNVTLNALPGENILKIHDATASAGENLSINLEIINDDPFVAFETDITLPDGFGFISGSAVLNPARKLNHSINSTVLPGTNVLRLIAFSITNAHFTGNSGIVATFTLTTPSSGSGTYVLSPENNIIGNAKGQNILTGSIPGTITFNPPQTILLCFVITDPNGNPITNATIELCGIFNSPGQYCFAVLPGISCTYTIQIPGLQPSSGSIITPYQNTQIHIIVPLFPLNIMRLIDTTAVAGQPLWLALEIINEDTFVGFQHDVSLPAGFGYISGSAVLNPIRKTDHVINANILQGTNVLRAISYSLTNSNFLGNSGVIASCQLTTPYTAGVYTLTPENATVSNAQGQNILTGTEPGTITLTAPQAYTVTFDVKDQNQNPVNGASITLGNTTNPPGNYVFSQVLPGNFHYMVAKAGYEIAQGYVEVVDENVTVNVALQTLGGNQGVMILHNVSTLTGQNAVVNIEIINSVFIVAFQLDIPLPAGFGYVPGSAFVNPARNGGHLINGDVLPGTNVLRIICFSLAGGFQGNEGIIASFTLSTPATPGVYTLNPENVIISNGQGQNVHTGTIPGTVTLTSPASLHSVNFVVQDVNLVPVAGATITLGNSANPAGNYMFHNVPPGTYNFTVQKFGFTNYTGSVNVTEPNETVTVTLTNYGNVMILRDVLAVAGDSILVELEINNQNNFPAFGLDILLPDGFGYVPGSVLLNPARKVDHLIQANVLPGTNILRTISFSLTNALFLGKSGVIVSYILTTPTVPGIYELVIQNAIMGHSSSQNIITGVQNGFVTLTSPTYTVTFVVQGIDQQPISGATITLGSIINLPGNYVFTNILPGIYPYTVTKADYTPVAGNIAVIDQDLTIMVTLDIDGNIMILHPVTGIAGQEIQVELEILNQSPVFRFQLDIVLPAGFGFVPGSLVLNPLRAPDFINNAYMLPETNVLRMIAFPLLNVSLTGNSGIVANFGLTTATTQGNYELIIENAVLVGASGTNIITGVVNGSVTLLLPPIGITEPENETVQIYPIPASELLYVVTENPTEMLRLYNHTGQIVFEKNQVFENTVLINVKSFPQGVYLLQLIRNDRKAINRKILIIN